MMLEQMAREWLNQPPEWRAKVIHHDDKARGTWVSGAIVPLDKNGEPNWRKMGVETRIFLSFKDQDTYEKATLQTVTEPSDA